MRRTRVRVLGLGCVAALVGLVAAHGALSTSSSVPPTKAPGRRTRAEMLGRFLSVFADSKGFNRSIPSVIMRVTAPGSIAERVARPEPNLAVSVRLPGSVTVWLIPGATGVCTWRLASASSAEGASGAGTCASIATTEAGRNFGVLYNAAHQVLWGVVPDGSKKVAVLRASGPTEEVHVVRNVFEVSVAARDPIIALTIQDSHRRPRTYHIPRPPPQSDGGSA